MNILKKTIFKRRQLFEIQDFSWCPNIIRDTITDLLVLNLKIVPLYEPVIPYLSAFAKMTNGKWIDLCAGAGGGSILLKEKLPGQVKELILTDLYPHQNLMNLPFGVRVYPTSVDATKVPNELAGFRSLFTSFHHLNDEVAKEVLMNAQATKTPIGIFEFTERSIFCLLLMLPSFFTAFFLVPVIKPWKLSRIILTYLLPLIPIVTLIDIVLSCFRTRDTHELKELIKDLRTEDYMWEVGKLPTYFGLSITFIVGMPKDPKD